MPLHAFIWLENHTIDEYRALWTKDMKNHLTELLKESAFPKEISVYEPKSKDLVDLHFDNQLTSEKNTKKQFWFMWPVTWNKQPFLELYTQMNWIYPALPAGPERDY